MEIVEHKSPGALTLTLKGRLDASTVEDFEARVIQYIEAGEHRIVLDFASLDYINSVGLRALIIFAKRLKPLDGGIALCGLQPVVRQILDIAGLSTIFPIAASPDEAIAKLG